MDQHNEPSTPTSTSASVDRRWFLGATGAGTLAAALPGMDARPAQAATGASGAGVPKASAATAQDLPLIGGDEFPIGIYWPPPPFETTSKRYQEIADAGFTFIIGGNYLADRYILEYACGIADQVGLELLVHHDPRLWAMTHVLDITSDGSQPLTLSVDEARTLLGRVIDTYEAHPSFAGINFYDEPGVFGKIPTVGQAFSLFRELDPNRLPYTNLARGISSNEANLREFIQLVDPPLISFDHYMLFTDSIDTTWFRDWATVRRAGLEHNLPTWTYILSVPHLGYRAPSTAEMLWQVNVSLAYGCKGIQYFTYWTPEPARGGGFHDALITVDGRRTERYDGAKWINNHWLSRVGRQLKPLTSAALGVANLPENPPAGLPRFQPDSHVKQAEGDPVIISRFTATGSSEYQWVLVVNYSLDQQATARLDFGSKVRGNGVSQFDPDTERYEDTVAPERQLAVTLEPGAASLYRLDITH